MQARAIKRLPRVFAFTVLKRQQPPAGRMVARRCLALSVTTKARQFLDGPGQREAAHRHAGPRARSATATLWLRRVQLRLARRRRLLPPQARGFREATFADWVRTLLASRLARQQARRGGAKYLENGPVPRLFARSF